MLGGSNVEAGDENNVAAGEGNSVEAGDGKKFETGEIELPKNGGVIGVIGDTGGVNICGCDVGKVGKNIG